MTNRSVFTSAFQKTEQSANGITLDQSNLHVNMEHFDDGCTGSEQGMPSVVYRFEQCVRELSTLPTNNNSLPRTNTERPPLTLFRVYCALPYTMGMRGPTNAVLSWHMHS